MIIVLCTSENDVRLQIVQDLVLTEVTELWQVENALVPLDLIEMVVEHLDNALSNKVNLFDCSLIINDNIAWRLNSTIHANDKVIDKTSFTLLKIVTEAILKLFEYSDVGHEICLHSWGDLLVEGELFYNKIKVVKEGLLDELSDLSVELRL